MFRAGQIHYANAGSTTLEISRGAIVRVLSIICVACLATVLSACGGSKSEPTDQSSPPATNPDEVALVSTVGTASGAAVTQLIGTQGGGVNAAGMTVIAPPGALANGNLTVQPITDTLNGTGTALSISSDVPWTKFLTVSFPLEASDLATGMGVAVQQADGSWRSLAPVRIDPVSGTVSAGLPADTEAVNPTVATRAVRSATAGPIVKRVAKAWLFKLKPFQVLVRANEKTHFTPMTREFESLDPSCPPFEPSPDPLSLAPLTPIPRCWRQISGPRPMRNQLDGYQRAWSVSDNGNGTSPTLDTTGNFGADFQAPGLLSSGTPYAIKFESERVPNPSGREVAVFQGAVKVFRDGLATAYSGTASFEGNDNAGNLFKASGNLQFRILRDLGFNLQLLPPGTVTTGTVIYEAIVAPMDVEVTLSGCEPVKVRHQVKGAISMLIEPRSDFGVANSYVLNVESDHIDTATTNCDGHSIDIPVAFGYSSGRRCLYQFDQMINASGLIEGGANETCDDGSIHIGSWRFTGS